MLHAGKITVTAANNCVGQMCGTAADNVLSSSYGLSGHVLNCYGKSGEGNLVGGTAAFHWNRWTSHRGTDERFQVLRGLGVWN